MMRIPAAAAIGCMLLTFGCASPAPGGGEDPPLSVMTFNVRYGTADDGENSWEKRADLATGIVRLGQPAAVGMQELLPFQREAFLAACPGYDAVGRGREADGSGEQSAILFLRARLELLETGNFWLSETPEIAGSKSWDSSLPRMCTWARFRDRATGKVLFVFNTHLDHRGELARQRGARLIMERIETRESEGPVVLTGDLNAVPDSPPLLELAPLTDAWRAAHPGEPDIGTFHGFHGGTDGPRIDYILVTPDVKVIGAKVLAEGRDGRYPSDHHPVNALLSLP